MSQTSRTTKPAAPPTAPPAEPVVALAPHVQPADGDGHDDMVEMARQNERAHLAPAPEATAPGDDPFPRGVLAASWWGMIVGAFVGLGFGWLLVNRLLVIPGWEQLYSMTPGTFWTEIGAAIGLLLAGLAAILVVPGRERDGEGRPARYH